ncbi:Mu transposase C-terminal domain-containing protein [Anaerovorax sp. IOR16]|uniref:Mu transposase C-terminal domain-containing protein n=2 Tax=Anaerovorax sp. IOR16 TaxID=2773458 RepID=UPI0019CFFD4D|nr:Mu transposase C-terminal domain-containing protein [Anaerovorax sp. IOR16]
MVTWLTTADVAELYGVTERTIQRRITKGTFDGKVKETIGAKNKKAYMIDLSSLSLDKQKQYLLSKGEERAELIEDEVQKDEGNLEEEYTLGELREIHGEAFEEKLEEALKKKEAVLKFISLGHGEKTSGVKAICKEYGFSQRALYRYRKTYDEYGFVGLIKKPRKDKGESRLPDEAIRFIRGCYLQPMRPKITHVVKMYRKKAEKMGWAQVSKDTIYREIEKIPEPEKCLAFEGERAYNAKYMPCITRTYDDLMVNEYWVDDGHTLAIWTPEDGKIKRYTMSAWMDMRTRAMVGWCIARNSNSQVIAAALRSSIIRYGLPGTCYMDNGKDYKSGYLNADTKEEFFRGYEGIFKALDIKTSFAIPFNAKAKPIERFFETFSSELSRYLVGFCGESIEERPHNISKKEILIQGLSILDVSKFIEGYMESYNNSPHSSLGGKTPMEVMKEVDLIRHDMPTEEELDMLMLRAEVKTISSSGIKKFGIYYWDDKLIPHFGKSCVVRYDPNNIGELYVYVDGKLTCKAENKELMSMNATEEDMKRWGKLKAEAKRATKEAIKAYEVRQDEVRRYMLEDYVDEETLNNMLTPRNKEVVNKAKVVRMNKHTAKGKEKKEFDTEIENNKGFEFFEKLGEEFLQAK